MTNREFYKIDPPINVELASPIISEAECNQNERPKTSRGVANPSPDEYFAYVNPSPRSKPSFESDRILIHVEKERSEQAAFLAFALLGLCL